MIHLMSIIIILAIPMLFVLLFASHLLEEMTIQAEYIGVVNITKAEKFTVASERRDWNKKSDDNASRMKFISFLSASIGTVEGNPILAGVGFISSGIGAVHRDWSSVLWCSYDDNKINKRMRK